MQPKQIMMMGTIPIEGGGLPGTSHRRAEPSRPDPATRGSFERGAAASQAEGSSILMGGVRVARSCVLDVLGLWVVGGYDMSRHTTDLFLYFSAFDLSAHSAEPCSRPIV